MFLFAPTYPYITQYTALQLYRPRYTYQTSKHTRTYSQLPLPGHREPWISVYLCVPHTYPKAPLCIATSAYMSLYASTTTSPTQTTVCHGLRYPWIPPTYPHTRTYTRHIRAHPYIHRRTHAHPYTPVHTRIHAYIPWIPMHTHTYPYIINHAHK